MEKGGNSGEGKTTEDNNPEQSNTVVSGMWDNPRDFIYCSGRVVNASVII